MNTLRQGHKPEQLTHSTARLADDFAHLILGIAVFVDQVRQAAGFIQGMQIFALDILNQGNFRRITSGQDGGNGLFPEALKGPITALAGHHNKAVWLLWVTRHSDRLQEPMLRDRLRQLLQRRRREGRAGLLRIRAQFRHVHLENSRQIR